MPKKIIAVDIDEVLSPHFEDLMNWYNRTYGTKLTLANNHPADDDVEPWGTKDMYTARRRVHNFFETTEFLAAKPYKEAIKILRILSKTYILVVVTSRDSMIEKVTREWLDKHFNELFAEAHFTARYSVEGKARSKSDICLEIGAKYLIDDSLEQALEAAHRGITVLLFGEYPWNQATKLPKNIIRVTDWKAVLECFDAKG